MATDPATIIPEEDAPPSPPPAPPSPPPAPPSPPSPPPPGDEGDWRARMAGDDADLLKFLGRYQSEGAATKEFKKLHGEIRSGKFIKPLDENATDEEKAAYRKHLGVPDAPEGYLDKLPDGLVVGEDDRPFVDVFLGKMHEAGAPPGLTGAALEAYYQIVEEQAATEADQLAAAKTAGDDALREEWGKDYRRTLNVVHGHLDTLPEEVKKVFTHGKGVDGLPHGYNPEVMKWLASVALEANPLATVVPGAGANQTSAIADEIAALEARMANDRKAYFRDEKAQARYLELIAARDKLPK